MKIKAGSTNVSVYYYIVQDASGANPGEPVTGLLFSDIETGGSASYTRQGAASTDLTLITLGSASIAHADGGFILVDDTKNPGLYRCDYPDAAFVAGVDQTFCQIVVAAAKNAVAAPILVDIDGTFDANLIQINGATVPVDNLEAQYDTTGISGDNFPSTQAQVGSLSSGAGGLSNIQDSFTLTIGGTPTNTAADTETLNAVLHIIPPDAGNTDFYYEFDLGVNGVATAIKWNGYVQTNGDTATAQLFNWVTSLFEDQNVLIGSNGTTVSEEDFPTPTKYTGTGANAGKVRFGFNSTTTTAIATDRVLCLFTSLAAEATILDSGIAQAGTNNSITLASTASSIDGFYDQARVTAKNQEAIIVDYDGTTKKAFIDHIWKTNPDATTPYEVLPGSVHAATVGGGYDDASVWLDSNFGEAGVIPDFNGISTRKSSVMADARTIADIKSIRKFRFQVGSVFVLDQDYDNWEFGKSGEVLVLNNKSISGTNFERCAVTGTGTGSVTSTFEQCGLVGPVSVRGAQLLNCGIITAGGDFDLVTGDTYVLNHCSQGPFGSVIDFNGNGVLTTSAFITGFKGELIIKSMTSTDVLLFIGDGKITFDASCTGGAVTLSGNHERVDNSTGGGVTIAELARYDITRIVNGGAITTSGGLVDITQAAADKVWATVVRVVTAATNIFSSGSAVDTTAGVIDNVDVVATLTGHTPQTGDSFNRLGAPAGASVSADNAAIKFDTGAIAEGTTQLLSDTLAILTDTSDMQPKLGTPNATLAADIAAIVTQVLTTQMTESYAAVGVVPTLTQAVMLIQQKLNEISVVDTTQTVLGIDGETVEATFTQDLANNPTSVTRTT